MKKTVIFVVGMQCAGKTVLTGTLANSGASVCCIGEEIRKKIDVTSFEDAENPYAPQITEAFAQQAIRDAIKEFKLNDKSLLVIDSAPRNEYQYLIIKNMLVKDEVLVIFVYEKYDVRLKRAIKKYDGKLSYFMKRESFENDWLKILENHCIGEHVNYITVGEK